MATCASTGPARGGQMHAFQMPSPAWSKLVLYILRYDTRTGGGGLDAGGQGSQQPSRHVGGGATRCSTHGRRDIAELLLQKRATASKRMRPHGLRRKTFAPSLHTGLTPGFEDSRGGC